MRAEKSFFQLVPLIVVSGPHGIITLTDISTALPKRAWRRIRHMTFLLTALSIAASVILTNIIMETYSAGLNIPGLMSAILMPAVLGGPMMFYLTLRREQLRHANEQLRILAETDWLTRCLNRGAFTRRVETDLAQAVVDGRTGALLIVDADDFKQVNDRFGHQTGDEAIILIAEAIRTSVRSTDLVGRLGGEEFGVYIANAGPISVDLIAERIRHSIAALPFAPCDAPYPLSVSIGGATFARPAQYDALFKLADERLYAAKNNGRDCIELSEAA
jgi:diguanylate cyclase